MTRAPRIVVSPNVMRVQGSVKRRAANIGRVGDIEGSGGNRSLRYSSIKAAQRVIEYTTKHYSSGNTDETKVLRRRMIQAGVYDPHAVAYFFLGRTVLVDIVDAKTGEIVAPAGYLLSEADVTRIEKAAVAEMIPAIPAK